MHARRSLAASCPHQDLALSVGQLSAGLPRGLLQKPRQGAGSVGPTFHPVQSWEVAWLLSPRRSEMFLDPSA